MAENAITDEVCDLNPFKGIRIANDPRAKKEPASVCGFTSRTSSHRQTKESKDQNETKTRAPSTA
jgi:hypothetical protein